MAASSSTNSAALQSSSDSPLEQAGSNRQYRSESPRGSVGLTRDGPASNLGSCEDRIALSSGALARWPLCSPGTSFPFTVGPRVRIRLAPAESPLRTWPSRPRERCRAMLTSPIFVDWNQHDEGGPFEPKCRSGSNKCTKTKQHESTPGN